MPERTILGGVLPMPGGDIAEPIIDIDDIAEVVTAALTEEGQHRPSTLPMVVHQLGHIVI